MDRATYEAAFKILLALDECVNKAILQLEELEAMEEESFKLAALLFSNKKPILNKWAFFIISGQSHNNLHFSHSRTVFS